MKFYEQVESGFTAVYVCSEHPEHRFELRIDQYGAYVGLDLRIESARLDLHDCIVNCRDRCGENCEVRDLRSELGKNGY